MAALPPPPTTDQTGSFAWLEWFRQLRNYISTVGSVPWNIINFTGSTIANIATRSHNLLQSIQGGSSGEYYHMTLAKSQESTNEIVEVSTSTYTVTTETILIINYAGTCTITFPAAVSYSSRKITVKTITANTVVSVSSNVVPNIGGVAGTAILAATAGKWAELISNGTNWVIMTAN
jgi:hypothetical protein